MFCSDAHLVRNRFTLFEMRFRALPQIASTADVLVRPAHFGELHLLLAFCVAGAISGGYLFTVSAQAPLFVSAILAGMAALLAFSMKARDT